MEQSGSNGKGYIVGDDRATRTYDTFAGTYTISSAAEGEITTAAAH